MIQIEANKAEFIKILKSVERKGIDNLISYLESSDFFTAPASTKYHLAESGGLALHSLNVLQALEGLDLKYKLDIDPDSLIIAGLLHDLCKIGNYKEEKRNGELVWVYVDEEFPMGHGAKSVFIIRRFIELTDDEALAIMWHMGAWDLDHGGTQKKSLNRAVDKSTLVSATHLADMIATHLMEY